MVLPIGVDYRILYHAVVRVSVATCAKPDVSVTPRESTTGGPKLLSRSIGIVATLFGCDRSLRHIYMYGKGYGSYR